MEANLQLTAEEYSVIMLIVNDIFVRFTIMKLKYIITTLNCLVFNSQNLYVPIDKIRYCSRNLELKLIFM